MSTLRAIAVLAVSFVSLSGGAPAVAADAFPTVVRKILDHQTDGPLAEMPPAKRARMTDCVVQALQPLPSGFKRKIVEGKDLEEQQHRFGEVVNDNHAKWKQNIAKACSEIATAE